MLAYHVLYDFEICFLTEGSHGVAEHHIGPDDYGCPSGTAYCH
jgi:hypothetical protein